MGLGRAADPAQRTGPPSLRTSRRCRISCPGFIDENRPQLRPALDKLNGVLTIVDNRKGQVQKSISCSTPTRCRSVSRCRPDRSSRPTSRTSFRGKFIQPFVDAAFSDLGLDPHTLSPSERVDAPTGQHRYPGACRVPYPRTGQGGEPRLNLPDAITGKPGDQGCGPPGLPLPGPTGCYPYREPPPPGTPGGPPPGPPAVPAPNLASVPEPTPTPVYVQAPGEVPPRPAP